MQLQSHTWLCQAWLAEQHWCSQDAQCFVHCCSDKSADQKQSCEGSNKLIGVAAVTHKAVSSLACRAAQVQTLCICYTWLHLQTMSAAPLIIPKDRSCTSAVPCFQLHFLGLHALTTALHVPRCHVLMALCHGSFACCMTRAD